MKWSPVFFLILMNTDQKPKTTTQKNTLPSKSCCVLFSPNTKKYRQTDTRTACIGEKSELRPYFDSSSAFSLASSGSFSSAFRHFLRDFRGKPMYRGFITNTLKKLTVKKSVRKKNALVLQRECEWVCIMHYIMALLTSLDPNLSIKNTHSMGIIESESVFFRLSIAAAAVNLYWKKKRFFFFRGVSFGSIRQSTSRIDTCMFILWTAKKNPSIKKVTSIFFGWHSISVELWGIK